MRITIITGFLSLFLLSIFVPALDILMSDSEETVLVMSHTEEEQQESEKKDKSEEKIIPENFNALSLSGQTEIRQPANKNEYLNSDHIPEIPLPPPEHIS